jgi:hypothetical protein
MVGGARFEQAPGGPENSRLLVSGSCFKKISDNWFSDCGFGNLFPVVDSNGWFQSDGFRKLFSKK